MDEVSVLQARLTRAEKAHTQAVARAAALDTRLAAAEASLLAERRARADDLVCAAEGRDALTRRAEAAEAATLAELQARTRADETRAAAELVSATSAAEVTGLRRSLTAATSAHTEALVELQRCLDKATRSRADQLAELLATRLALASARADATFGRAECDVAARGLADLQAATTADRHQQSARTVAALQESATLGLQVVAAQAAAATAAADSVASSARAFVAEAGQRELTAVQQQSSAQFAAAAAELHRASSARLAECVSRLAAARTSGLQSRAVAAAEASISSVVCAATHGWLHAVQQQHPQLPWDWAPGTLWEAHGHIVAEFRRLVVPASPASGVAFFGGLLASLEGGSFPSEEYTWPHAPGQAVVTLWVLRRFGSLAAALLAGARGLSVEEERHLLSLALRVEGLVRSLSAAHGLPPLSLPAAVDVDSSSASPVLLLVENPALSEMTAFLSLPPVSPAPPPLSLAESEARPVLALLPSQPSSSSSFSSSSSSVFPRLQ
ncbi:MAG: hypothetical protein Q8R01_11440 [Ramlibacter sp.]|nr:hypothetical protein [Ramlibacter sp.]